MKLDGRMFLLPDGIFLVDYPTSTTYQSARLSAGEYQIRVYRPSFSDETAAKANKVSPIKDYWSPIVKVNGVSAVTVNGTVYSSANRSASPFKDVPVSLSAANTYLSIEWLYRAGITTGTATSSGRVFAPKGTLSRADVAAFMYRASAPAAYTAPAKSPFLDVPTTHKFYKQIAWMYTSGTSTGWAVSGGKQYRPNDPVSREALSAFVYRAYNHKRLVAPRKDTWVDVPLSHKFSVPINWIRTNGLLNDPGSHFSPSKPATREEFATILYRIELAK